VRFVVQGGDGAATFIWRGGDERDLIDDGFLFFVDNRRDFRGCGGSTVVIIVARLIGVSLYLHIDVCVIFIRGIFITHMLYVEWVASPPTQNQ
jgi:hypothetical protein